MRAALLAFLLLAGCARQDAALEVTISGAFRIPADADKLHLEILDGPSAIQHKDWCASPTAGCDALAPQTPLSGSVTVVQSGGSHPHVKINVSLYLGAKPVGAGTAAADFQPGSTVAVPITVSPL